MVAQMIKDPQCGRPAFDPWVGKIPWRRKWQPTLVLLPGESHGQRSLVGYSPWCRKESNMTEQLTLSYVCVCVCVYTTYMWNLKKRIQRNLLTTQKLSHRSRKQTYSYQEIRRGGVNWETGIDMYTLVYKKQTININQLISRTGNSTEYSTMVYMGKNL